MLAMVRQFEQKSDPLCRRKELTYAVSMGHLPDDSALMLRYQDGDTAAFDTLYRRHNDALYRYLLRLCRHRDTAEDIFQDVWSKIIKARASYRPTAKFTTFMYRVAHNSFIDHIRRNKRHANSAEFDAEYHADPGEPPDMAVEKMLARERLLRALQHLPDEQRDAFLLREEAGLSIDQIALVTGSNRETAKSRLRYANKKLREAIADAATEPDEGSL